MNDFPRGVPTYTKYFGTRHDEIMERMFVDNPVYEFEISGSDPGCFSDDQCDPMHQQTFVDSADRGENTFSDSCSSDASGYCNCAAENSISATGVTAFPSYCSQPCPVSDHETCNDDFQNESDGIQRSNADAECVDESEDDEDAEWTARASHRKSRRMLMARRVQEKCRKQIAVQAS
jgi:hypothetical protein